MTKLIAGPELDFQIAQAIGLEPLGIYTGWAPDGCFSWCDNGDWKRVVINYDKLWPEWDCKHIHEGFEVDKLFHPDTYDRFHKEFFAKFGHYTSCCAPAPEYSIDLNAAIEAARQVGMFDGKNFLALCNSYDNRWYVSGWKYGTRSPFEITPALAICSAILERKRNGPA